MSRVGREPISIPSDVTVALDQRSVTVKGKLGELQHTLPPGIELLQENNIINISRSDNGRRQRSLHGLTRSLLANMIHGVDQGFKKNLEIIGVGYRCEQRGSAIQLYVGFSHRVILFPPDGVDLKVATPNAFTVSGIDKQVVGDTAAKLRSIRPPEPYKGKGIRYVGEYVRRKAGKTAGK
ncbi:MAG: 50S ribosomal protein L6 [Candidatus Electryoneaceae bacterium]|nr:50S ribosomal protein L6 [Candidatus Electryoneaceae bacterium]